MQFSENIEGLKLSLSQNREIAWIKVKLATEGIRLRIDKDNDWE